MSKPLTIQEIKPDDHNCINCAFFDQFEIQKRTENVIGACKANPPSVPLYTDMGESKLGIWPSVLGTWWCGLFSGK